MKIDIEEMADKNKDDNVVWQYMQDFTIQHNKLIKRVEKLEEKINEVK